MRVKSHKSSFALERGVDVDVAQFRSTPYPGPARRGNCATSHVHAALERERRFMALEPANTCPLGSPIPGAHVRYAAVHLSCQPSGSRPGCADVAFRITMAIGADAAHALIAAPGNPPNKSTVPQSPSVLSILAVFAIVLV